MWRTLPRDNIERFIWMFKIQYVVHYFWRACAPDHSVRSVWRAPPLRSTPPLGDQSGHLGRQRRPRIPERPRPIRNHVAKVAPKCFGQPHKTSPRALSDLPVGIPTLCFLLLSALMVRTQTPLDTRFCIGHQALHSTPRWYPP